jgi:hypothetical protein
MARSKASYNKRAKELNKIKLRLDKAQRKEERKNNNNKGKALEDMLAYLDENGNLSTTPPSNDFADKPAG